MMMMCWNCEMMEEISIQFVRLDYFSNVCGCTRLTRLQLYKTKYVLRIAVTRSNPVPDIILSASVVVQMRSAWSQHEATNLRIRSWSLPNQSLLLSAVACNMPH